LINNLANNFENRFALRSSIVAQPMNVLRRQDDAMKTEAGIMKIKKSKKLVAKPLNFYHNNIHAKISGATMVASLSTINFGVLMSNFPHVIFSFGTAPE
jgi:hypothetical protein